MPILEDIQDHEVLGPVCRNGLKEGALKIVRRLIERRYGPLPAWAEDLLSNRTPPELEELGVQVFYTATLDDLLKPSPAANVDDKGQRWEFKRGQLTVLHQQIRTRFGGLPSWAEARLADRTPRELEELRIRMLHARSLAELLK